MEKSVSYMVLKLKNPPAVVCPKNLPKMCFFLVKIELICFSLDISTNLKPDSAIINLYHPGDTLSFHQDELEWDLTKPLVSISLGIVNVIF